MVAAAMKVFSAASHGPQAIAASSEVVSPGTTGSRYARSLVTSGLVRLTKPKLIGTLAGLMLAMLLAALDQTIVGTAEPRIIAQLAGFDRYPWWRPSTC
jgi:hypothetical protein